jgi:hypothetical protein
LAPLTTAFRDRPHLLYFLAVLLATSLGTMACIPAFLLARRWLPANEAIAAALVPAALPGMSTLGWAALTEPLFLLLMMLTAWRLVCAFQGGRLRDFLVSVVLAALCLAVHPFGLCCLLATIVGIGVWSVNRRRMLEASLTATVAIVLVATPLWIRFHQTGVLSLTNYPGEAAELRSVLTSLTRTDGWVRLTTSLLYDANYLFVATFGVIFVLALFAGVRAVMRLGALAFDDRAVLASLMTLGFSTLMLSGLMRLIEVPEVMYGRYIEPLISLLIISGAVVWNTIGQQRSARYLIGTVVVLGTVAAWRLTPGEFTEANSGGYWYWQVLRQRIHPAAACSVPLLLWSAWALMPCRRTLALSLLIIFGLASTSLIALRIHQANDDLTDLRHEAQAIAGAARNQLSVNTELWLDPRIGIGGEDSALAADYLLWLLRYELPDVPIDFSGEILLVRRNDLLLTFADFNSQVPIWRGNSLALYDFIPASNESISGSTRSRHAAPPAAANH